MELSIAKLQDLGACQDQLDLLVRLFGTGPVTVTAELCIQHANDGINWNWAVNNVLKSAAQAEFTRIEELARTEFGRVQELACEKFFRLAKLALAKYSPGQTEFDLMMAMVLKELDRIRPARSECNRALASAFGRLAEMQYE